MDLIRKIEVKYFRSIYEIEIDELSHVNVFSGLNDVGKSNLLKTLNMFFNGYAEARSSPRLNFDTNTLHRRTLEEPNATREISVKLYFEQPPGKYDFPIPRTFWAERRWDIWSSGTSTTKWGTEEYREHCSNLPGNAVKDMLDRFHYFYVPVHRGESTLRYLLMELVSTFSSQPDAIMEEASERVVAAVESRSSNLLNLLREVTDINFELHLPKSFYQILQVFSFQTDGIIGLERRGDGIQGIVVPVILDYLGSQHNDQLNIWGFEEPENSLEYRRASSLAEELVETYSLNAQVFLTTHSPAFLDMQHERASVYRVFKSQQTNPSSGHVETATAVEPIYIRGAEAETNILPEELGFLKIVRQFNREIKELLANREAEISRLRQQVRKLTAPTLIVEGKHDVETLEHAWLRLYATPMPFDITEVNGENGVGDLVKLLINFPNGRRNAALLDNDHAGIDRFNKLWKRFCGKDDRRISHSFICGDVMTMTLPPPSIPDRNDQALNKNLSMEFYFSDDFLNEIDGRSGYKLFRTDKWINEGKHVDLDEDSLKLLFDRGKKSMIHRALNNDESAKKKVVEALGELDEVDFLPFHALFEKIMGHLQPGVIHSLKPSITAVVSA